MANRLADQELFAEKRHEGEKHDCRCMQVQTRTKRAHVGANGKNLAQGNLRMFRDMSPYGDR